MTKRPRPKRKKTIGLETYDNETKQEPEYEKIRREQIIEKKIVEKLEELPKKFFTVTWIDWLAVLLLIVILIFMVMDRQRILAFIFGIAVVFYILKMSIKVK
jgi:MFS superfamily sulfate permease-like transporter